MGLGRRYLRSINANKTVHEANSAIVIANFMNGTSIMLFTKLRPLRFKVFFKLKLALGAYAFQYFTQSVLQSPKYILY